MKTDSEMELLKTEAQSLAKELGYTDLYWMFRRDIFKRAEIEWHIRMPVLIHYFTV